jgi:hypothetical protein
LPWPFGRGSDASAGEADASPVRGPTQAGNEHPTAPPPGPVRGAWATLPPIQRVVAEPPLVASPEVFAGEVPGARGLPPILTPLGHDVSPTAPAGIVVAHPHAVPSLTSHADLVPRPVQRRATRDELEPAFGMEATPVADATVASAVSPGAPVPTLAASGPAVPVRRIEPVSPAATVRPAPRPLTRAPAAPTPVAPVVARTPKPGVGPGMRTAQAPRSGAADRPLVTRRTGQPAGPGSPAVTPTVRAAAVPATPAAGTRRPGLGAPIAAPPPSATPATPVAGAPLRGVPHLQRSIPAQAVGPGATGGPTVPAGAFLGPTIQRRPSDAAAPSAAGGEVGRPLPVLPLARPAVTDRGPSGAREPDRSGALAVRAAPAATSPVAPQAAPAVTSTAAPPAVTATRPTGTFAPDRSTAPIASTAGRAAPVRPLVGQRPLRPTVSAQRATAEAVPQGPAVPPTPAAVPGGTTSLPATAEAISRLRSAAAVGPVDDGHPAHPADPSGARPTVPPVPTWTAGPGAHAFRGGVPTAPTAPTFPAVQRAVAHRATPAPTPASPWPSAAALPGGIDARPGAAAAPGGLAWPTIPAAPRTTGSRPAAMPLARTPAPAAAATPEPTVSRSIVAAPSQPPTVQTTSAGEPGPVLAPTATPIVQRVDGAAPATPEAPAAGGQSDEELDVLAKAIFGRIRNRLRSDLIHEREAKGLTFDNA